jgi:hypothetical protein
MNLKAFFSGLGKNILKAAKYILKRVPDVQLDIAIGIVKVAAGKFIDNEQRRNWAVGQIMSELKLPESLARWLVETAVIHAKAEAEDVIEKAGDKVKDLN